MPPNITLYTADQVKQLDRALAVTRHISTWELMQEAAAAAYAVLKANWPEAKRIIIMAGSGNNAGDGWVLGGLLEQAGMDVLVITIKPTNTYSGDAALAVEQALDQNCAWQLWNTQAAAHLIEADVIVDSLLGTGLHGVLREEYALAVSAINASQAVVLSMDLPSGLHPDTGVVKSQAVQADITISFVAWKRGLFTLDGPDYSGQQVLADLGLANHIEQLISVIETPTVICCQAIQKWPKRRHNSHKKSYGHVVVIAGNQGMAGAGLLTAQAALRAGAGLVTLVTHSKHADHLYSVFPELMFYSQDDHSPLPEQLLARADCIVIGPGLGVNAWAEHVWSDLCQWCKRYDKASAIPIVVDADGLQLLRECPITDAALVLTPHPGEAALLAMTSSRQIQEDRFYHAVELARQYQATIVLKGNGTLITDISQQALSPFGSPGMATAGMGDVLAGICGAFLGQDPMNVFESTCHAVVVHGLAGERAASEGEWGMLASDVISAVRQVLP